MTSEKLEPTEISRRRLLRNAFVLVPLLLIGESTLPMRVLSSRQEELWTYGDIALGPGPNLSATVGNFIGADILKKPAGGKHVVALSGQDEKFWLELFDCQTGQRTGLQGVDHNEYFFTDGSCLVCVGNEIFFVKNGGIHPHITLENHNYVSGAFGRGPKENSVFLARTVGDFPPPPPTPDSPRGLSAEKPEPAGPDKTALQGTKTSVDIHDISNPGKVTIDTVDLPEGVTVDRMLATPDGKIILAGFNGLFLLDPETKSTTTILNDISVINILEILPGVYAVNGIQNRENGNALVSLNDRGEYVVSPRSFGSSRLDRFAKMGEILFTQGVDSEVKVYKLVDGDPVELTQIGSFVPNLGMMRQSRGGVVLFGGNANDGGDTPVLHTVIRRGRRLLPFL